MLTCQYSSPAVHRPAVPWTVAFALAFAVDQHSSWIMGCGEFQVTRKWLVSDSQKPSEQFQHAPVMRFCLGESLSTSLFAMVYNEGHPTSFPRRIRIIHIFSYLKWHHMWDITITWVWLCMALKIADLFQMALFFRMAEVYTQISIPNLLLTSNSQQHCCFANCTITIYNYCWSTGSGLL